MPGSAQCKTRRNGGGHGSAPTSPWPGRARPPSAVGLTCGRSSERVSHRKVLLVGLRSPRRRGPWASQREHGPGAHGGLEGAGLLAQAPLSRAAVPFPVEGSAGQGDLRAGKARPRTRAGGPKLRMKSGGREDRGAESGRLPERPGPVLQGRGLRAEPQGKPGYLCGPRHCPGSLEAGGHPAITGGGSARLLRAGPSSDGNEATLVPGSGALTGPPGPLSARLSPGHKQPAGRSAAGGSGARAETAAWPAHGPGGCPTWLEGDACHVEALGSAARSARSCLPPRPRSPSGHHLCHL